MASVAPTFVECSGELGLALAATSTSQMQSLGRE